MATRKLVWGGLGAVGLFGALGGMWLVSLPPAPAVFAPPPIPKDEADAIVAGLKPPKRQRPVIAILGINDATEDTDYLVPYGILRRAGVADVVALATQPGPVKLYPALTVHPQATIAEFDEQHADGADYVLVPAMSRDDDPAALAWLRSQAAKGATIVGVCAGAMVVGEAGLLDGKRATTHWYYVKGLRKRHPAIQYVADRRMVVDRGVATTTGITASMPMSLTLIEAIAGREKAEAVGREIGMGQWDARHDSDAFTFTRPFAETAIRNTIAFWQREQLDLELTAGIDEVSLALVADAWSRTYRSRALTLARTTDAVVSRGGLRIIPDRVGEAAPDDRTLPSIARQPIAALDATLHAIAGRYGSPTADFVAMQLEYPAARATAKASLAPARDASISAPAVR